MKKLMIAASMFAALSLASCGGGKEGEETNTDSTATAADTTVEAPETPEVDTTATADTTVTDAVPAEEVK